MICQVTFALFCLQGYCTVAGGQGDGGIGVGRSPEYREGGSARVGHIGRCLHLDVGNGACAGIKREPEADDGHLTGAHLIWNDSPLMLNACQHRFTDSQYRKQY